MNSDVGGEIKTSDLLVVCARFIATTYNLIKEHENIHFCTRKANINNEIVDIESHPPCESNLTLNKILNDIMQAQKSCLSTSVKDRIESDQILPLNDLSNVSQSLPPKEEPSNASTNDVEIQAKQQINSTHSVQMQGQQQNHSTNHNPKPHTEHIIITHNGRNYDNEVEPFTGHDQEQKKDYIISNNDGIIQEHESDISLQGNLTQKHDFEPSIGDNQNHKMKHTILQDGDRKQQNELNHFANLDKEEQKIFGIAHFDEPKHEPEQNQKHGTFADAVEKHEKELNGSAYNDKKQENPHNASKDNDRQQEEEQSETYITITHFDEPKQGHALNDSTHFNEEQKQKHGTFADPVGQQEEGLSDSAYNDQKQENPHNASKDHDPQQEEESKPHINTTHKNANDETSLSQNTFIEGNLTEGDEQRKMQYISQLKDEICYDLENLKERQTSQLELLTKRGELQAMNDNASKINSALRSKIGELTASNENESITSEFLKSIYEQINILNKTEYNANLSDQSKRTNLLINLELHNLITSLSKYMEGDRNIFYLPPNSFEFQDADSYDYVQFKHFNIKDQLFVPNDSNLKQVWAIIVRLIEDKQKILQIARQYQFKTKLDLAEQHINAFKARSIPDNKRDFDDEVDNFLLETSNDSGNSLGDPTNDDLDDLVLDELVL